MDPDIISSLQNELKTVKYDQKWEILRPTIAKLYETRTVKDIRTLLNKELDFPATEESYKYYIKRKWKLSKYIPKEVKEAIISNMRVQGKTSPDVVDRFSLDPKLERKVARYVKQQKKQGRNMDFSISSGDYKNKEDLIADSDRNPLLKWLTFWNSPFGPLSWLAAGDEAVALKTKRAIINLFEMWDFSGIDGSAQPPITDTIEDEQLVRNTQLLLEGKLPELMTSIDAESQKTMNKWMYYFWLWSFQWASVCSGHSIQKCRFSKPKLPEFDELKIIEDRIPGQLCISAVHSSRNSLNHSRVSNLSEHLLQSLETGEFSIIPEEELPISVPSLIKAVTMSKSGLFWQSVSFAIIGRNTHLLEELLNQSKSQIGTPKDFFPFHLAATYLDGSATCCLIFNCLLRSRFKPADFYINHARVSILDTLMFTILRSHSSCLPQSINSRFRHQTTFLGEEVDICGRWNADTARFLQLLSKRSTSIPMSWKHKFCHTSAQTICHVISLLFSSSNAPNINIPSSIFSTCCSGCQKEFDLPPLHALVIVALYLSKVGSEEEDLFGVLAVLLCLLSNGADASKFATVAHSFYQEAPSRTFCKHEKLRPAEFCCKVFYNRIKGSSISPRILIGWQLIIWVLDSASTVWKRGDPESVLKKRTPEFSNEIFERLQYPGIIAGEDIISDMRRKTPCSYLHRDFVGAPKRWMGIKAFLEKNESLPYPFSSGIKKLSGRPDNYFGSDDRLATLWATVQVELLSYRRCHVTDPWISEEFNMEDILKAVQSGEMLIVGSVLTKPHCKCGRFEVPEGRILPTAQDVYFNYEPPSPFNDRLRTTTIPSERM